jgi:hypothetical protein
MNANCLLSSYPRYGRLQMWGLHSSISATGVIDRSSRCTKHLPCSLQRNLLRRRRALKSVQLAKWGFWLPRSWRAFVLLLHHHNKAYKSSGYIHRHHQSGHQGWTFAVRLHISCIVPHRSTVPAYRSCRCPWGGSPVFIDPPLSDGCQCLQANERQAPVCTLAS